MQPPTLEELLLAEDKLEAARIQVQQMAYFKWQDAGCPENRSDEFWSQAELEWIEYYYVPQRNCRPPTGLRCSKSPSPPERENQPA